MADEKFIKALCAAAECEFAYAAASEAGLNWKPSESFLHSADSLVYSYNSRRRLNVKKTLVIAAIIMLLGLTVLFSSANVRDEIIKIFAQENENFVHLEYGSENAGDIYRLDDIEETLVLKLSDIGFKQINRDKTSHSIRTQWQRGEDFAILSQGDGITTHSVDTKELKCDTVIKQGITFKHYYRDGYFLLMWNTDKYTYSLDCGGDISYEEMIDIILSPDG